MRILRENVAEMYRESRIDLTANIGMLSILNGLRSLPKGGACVSHQGNQQTRFICSLLAWSLLISVIVSTYVFHLSGPSIKSNEERRVEIAVELSPLPDFTLFLERFEAKASSFSTEVIYRMLDLFVPYGCLYIAGYSTTDLSPP